MRTIQRHLLIDADDTLWENNIYYLRCTAKMTALMASHGLSRAETIAALDAVEQELIPTYGYGPDCYVRALGVTARRLLAGRHVDVEQVAEAARRCGDLVIEPPTVLLPAVPETLHALRASSQLTLVTKGVERFQRPKLVRSGLEQLFDQVYVVAEKDQAIYEQIVTELGVDRQKTWMIGNSPKSDINPAVAAGLGAIWLPHDHTWTAEHTEVEAPERVTVLQRFGDLVDFFGL